jgi:hypothetical protein
MTLGVAVGRTSTVLSAAPERASARTPIAKSSTTMPPVLTQL